MKEIYPFETIIVVAWCLKEDVVKHQVSHRIVCIVQLLFNIFKHRDICNLTFSS